MNVSHLAAVLITLSSVIKYGERRGEMTLREVVCCKFRQYIASSLSRAH